MSVTSTSIILAAIEAVQELNREAGTSCEALQAVISAAGVDGEQFQQFEQFCLRLTSEVEACFVHFTRVKPHLAKVRAHEAFLKLRLKSLPSLWKSMTADLSLPQLEPLDHQSVSRIVFEAKMKEWIVRCRVPARASGERRRLLADEENAVRYASGFVVGKMTKKVKDKKGPKAAHFRECLSQMANSNDNASFLEYTLEWLRSTDRGGLFLYKRCYTHIISTYRT